VSGDPLDRLSARLFQAAREEAVPNGAERRALDGMLRNVGAERVARMRTRLLLLAAALASLALFLAAQSRREKVAGAIAAEHPSVVRRAPTRLPATSTSLMTESVPAAVPSALTNSRPRPVAPERPSAPPTLADELEALRVAERSVSAGDPAGALKALDRYDRVLKGQKLRAEATLLRIEALANSGQSQAAAELAARFAKQNPSSPLVDRARSFIRESGQGGSAHEGK
jgi:hypothetical protein